MLPDLNAGSGASKRSQAELVVEVLDGCEGGVGLGLHYQCVYMWWLEEVKGERRKGVYKLSLVELVCGKRGNCWSEEGTG